MDNWTKELDTWAREATVLAEHYEKECAELNKPLTQQACVRLTTALVALRAAVRMDAANAEHDARKDGGK